MDNRHTTTAWILKALGIIQILIGLIAAYYGPLEIYVFYFFSDGGQFHYDGFGVGSFWFALLVVQNLAYYVLAGLLLPAGIGTIRLRRWALTLSILYLWGWLVTGAVVILNLIMLAPAFFRLSQNTAVTRLIMAGAYMVVFFVLAPKALLRFYKSTNVRMLFEKNDPTLYWTERYPFPLLAVLFLSLVCILALHLALFFQAMLPVFGKLMFGRQMVYIIAGLIVTLLLLDYGLIRLKLWAWRGALAYFSLLTISAAITFTWYSFPQIIGMMALPEYEVEFLTKLTFLQDYRLAGLVAIPLLLTLGLLIYSRRFLVGRETSSHI